MEQTCLVNPTVMIALQHRGAVFAGIKGDAIQFYIKKGSVLDNEDNLRLVREYMKEQYSYTLKVAIREI